MEHWKNQLDAFAEILRQRMNAIYDPGLLFGGTGAAVFFFHYAQYMNKPEYEDLAMSLLDNKNHYQAHFLRIDYSSGITGTGAGIEFLLQNDFLEGDSDEVLEDFDKILSRYIVSEEQPTISHLCGIGRYFISRVSKNPVIQTAHKISLIQIVDTLDNMSLSSKEANSMNDLLLRINELNIYPSKVKQMLKRTGESRMRPDYDSKMQQIKELYQVVFEQPDSELMERINVGLKGLSGVGLYILSQIDKKYQKWQSLL